MVQIQIENAQAIQNALNKFENKISKKVVRDGVTAILRPLLAEAKKNARAISTGRKKGVKKSQRMGSLIARHLVLQTINQKDLRRKYGRDAYGKRIWTRPGTDELFAQQAVALGGKYTRYYIPAAIEYGHAFPGRGGKNAPKDVAAKPFIRPVWDKNKPHLPKAFERHLVHAIHEENAKR